MPGSELHVYDGGHAFVGQDPAAFPEILDFLAGPPDPAARGTSLPGMYFGWFIFAGIAVVCILAGAIAMKRRSDYGNSEPDDDFDFDAYEGFDKQ